MLVIQLSTTLYWVLFSRRRDLQDLRHDLKLNLPVGLVRTAPEYVQEANRDMYLLILAHQRDPMSVHMAFLTTKSI
jgi:hypothetical protein